MVIITIVGSYAGHEYQITIHIRVIYALYNTMDMFHARMLTAPNATRTKDIPY